MQLKLKRSQRNAGVVSTKVMFCLDAMAQFTAEEQQSINRYKLGGEVIYSSETAKRHAEASAGSTDGSMLGGMKSLAFAVASRMNLNITINSLQKGQHIECKSLEELLGAEEALMEACRNLRGYLMTAATFDGRETLYDFSTASGEPVAQVSTPHPQLIAPAVAAVAMDTPALSEPAADTQAYALGDIAMGGASVDSGNKMTAILVCSAIFVFFMLYLFRGH